jgi:hypothetical protein
LWYASLLRSIQVSELGQTSGVTSDQKRRYAGWVATPMAEETLKDTAFVERALSTTPLQKVATPGDVARQIAVIASPNISGHVNGMNVMVDGGMVRGHVKQVVDAFADLFIPRHRKAVCCSHQRELDAMSKQVPGRFVV